MRTSSIEYLPSLAEILSGRTQVISWTNIALSLQDQSSDTVRLTAVEFLSLQQTSNLLSRSFGHFSKPSESSGNSYETRTAAISVSPDENEQYNITQIKEDTRWLSKELELDQVEALRTVLLEWQERPNSRLAAGYADAELASLSDAFKDRYQANPGASRSVFKVRDDDAFEGEGSRRIRMLHVQFREVVALRNVSCALLQLLFTQNDSSNAEDKIVQLSRKLYPDLHIVGEESLKDVRTIIEQLNTGHTWTVTNDVVNDMWIGMQLQSLSTQMEILLLCLRSSTHFASHVVTDWISLMSTTEFFTGILPTPFFSLQSVQSMQTLTSLATLAAVDAVTAISSLQQPSNASYVLNADTVTDIHEILFAAAEACNHQASPASLAWAFILRELKQSADGAREQRDNHHILRASDQTLTFDAATGRRSSHGGSIQQSVYEDVMDGIMRTAPVSDPVQYILRCTVELCHVFEDITKLAYDLPTLPSVTHAIGSQIIQELLSVSLSAIGYNDEILQPQLAILQPVEDYQNPVSDSRETFVTNDLLMDNVFSVAAARFPYEALPYLRLCRQLAHVSIFDEHGVQYITFRLRSLESFTQSAIGDFAAYHTIREDENLNLVSLESNVSIVPNRPSKLLGYGTENPCLSIIPRETLGEVISDSLPAVIKWQYSFSGLTFLGTWLELYYLGQLQQSLSTFDSAEEVVTEVVGIFAAILKTTVGEITAHPDRVKVDILHKMLAEASAELNNGTDIVTCILEILESELQAYRRRPSNTFNTAISISCIDFLTVLIHVRPDQVWASLFKSALVDVSSGNSLILAIATGVELFAEHFPLTERCSRLYAALVQSALQYPGKADLYPQSRKAGANTPATKTSSRICGPVLANLTSSMLAIFESMTAWPFSSMRQKHRITTSLCQTFEKILLLSNGVGEDYGTTDLNASFLLSSSALLQVLRPQIVDDIGDVNPLLRQMHVDLSGDEERTENLSLHMSLGAILALATTVVKMGRLKSPDTQALELQLFNAIPLITRMSLISHTLSRQSWILLRYLLSSVNDLKPVSLLGHLGSTSSISLLSVLNSLQNSASDEVRAEVWRLLEILVSRNQQWFAVVVLTGSAPDRMKENQQHKKNIYRGQSFLTTSIELLNDIDLFDSHFVTAVLKFMIEAQQNWPWATTSLQSQPELFAKLVQYTESNSHSSTSSLMSQSYHNTIAALVLNFVSVQLQHAKASRNMSHLTMFTRLLQWSTSNAVKMTSYNTSLHANLRRNFSAKYPGLQISYFKRKDSKQAEYGENYYYDLELADQVFAYDSSWKTGNKGAQSFSAEFVRANLNLSLVESELLLLHNFEKFCVENSSLFARNESTQKVLAHVVQNCMTANSEPHPAVAIFEDVLQTRASIALILIQQLAEVKVKGSDYRKLLIAAWSCVRANNGSYELAIVNDELMYWRTMMSIILMALQFHIGQKWQPLASDASPGALLRHTQQSIPTLLEIGTVVVGQGLRSVVGALQDRKNNSSSQPQSSRDVSIDFKDIGMILNVLNTILRISSLPDFASQLSERLISTSTLQSCFLLYSWSHTLTSSLYDNNPVCADMALRGLVSLSSLPPVAEEMAVEGVLNRIITARVTQTLQKVAEGASHLDTRPHCQFLYRLWAQGFLPICLNLLYAVGAPVGAEISMFLNQFPNQLRRASLAFAPLDKTGRNDALTVTVVQELSTLALISHILQTLRVAGASAAVDPTTIMPLGGYDEHKKALVEDIQDLANLKEEALKGKIVPGSEGELALHRQGNGLVQKIALEINQALVCLRRGEMDDEK